MTLSQKTQISEVYVKLESKETNGFIASKWFMAPETGNICKELQAGNIF
jgi:hypothetical protein